MQYRDTLKTLRAILPPDYQAKISDALRPDQQLTAAKALAAGAFAHLVAQVVWDESPPLRRRLIMWGADCAAHVLHAYERSYPDDARPRGAIHAARRDGGSAPYAIVRLINGISARRAAARALSAGNEAAYRGDWAAAFAAMAASHAVSAPSNAALNAGSAAVHQDVEHVWQAERLGAWLSDSPPYPLAV